MVQRLRLQLQSAAFVLLLLLGALFTIAPHAVSADQSGDFTYVVVGGKAVITGYTGAGGAVTIPSTLNNYAVVAIGNYSFSNCSSLTSVNIPSSVTSIGTLVFSSCPSLTGIYVDPSNAYYAHADGVLYNKAVTTLIAYPGGDVGAFTIPSCVTSIGYGAFFNCTSLTLVAIPESVISIGDLAFGRCTDLSSVAIGNGATSIGDQAFTGCSALANVTLGDNITTIGELAFHDCTALSSLTFLGVTAPTTVGADWISGTPSSLRGHAFANSNFPIPGSYFNGLLMGAMITDDYAYTLNGGNATITGYRGAGGAVVIPSTLDGHPVAAIGDYAFSSCSSLTSVSIPDGVTSLGYGAFFDCSALTSVVIPDGVKIIPGTVFDYCSSLTSVNIPNGVTIIGQDAFNSCTSLSSVTIPDSVTTIDNCAFNSCTSLSSVTIPGNVTSIGDTAFDYCTSLVSVSIPNSVVSIGHGEFQSCYKLTSVSIPSNLTSIGMYAFNFCTSLTAINVDPENPSYASVDGVLYNKALTTLIQFPGGKGGAFAMPNGVTSLGNYSFGSCAPLTSVTIPGTVQSIGKYAFCYCSSLGSLTFLGATAPTTVGANWITGAPSNQVGHAYAASNFPAPGGVFFGLLMGAYISAPGPPTNLTANPSSAQVVLSWTAPLYNGDFTISNYCVYRSTSETGNHSLVASVSGLSFTDTNLTNGQTYWYQVSAVNAIGEGNRTAPISSTPFVVAPTVGGEMNATLLMIIGAAAVLIASGGLVLLLARKRRRL